MQHKGFPNDASRWYIVVASNDDFYPRLGITLEKKEQRAIMQSIPIGIQKYNLGSVDAEGYKAYIKNVSNSFELDLNKGILGQFENLIEFTYVPPPPPPPSPPPPVRHTRAC